MRIVLDLETTSTVDLRLAGAQAYAEHPTTQITVLCYAIDDGPVRTVDYYQLHRPPAEFVRAIESGEAIVVAHNYLFEFNLYQHKLVPLVWPRIPLEQWSCTMARAYVAGYPGSLELAGKAAKLSIQKDTGARDLMLRMARPRTTNPHTWWHETSPDHYARLCEYCAKDVIAERLLDKAVPQLSPRERAIFDVDHYINQRGLMIDLNLVDRLHTLAEDAMQGVTLKLIKVTNGQITTPNQVARIREWLGFRGVNSPDLKRHTVRNLLLDQSIQGEARTVLQARLDASRSSVAKLSAIAAARSPDGRVRGCFQYYGANRTGRWAGRRVQPQNLYKGSITDIPSALVSVMHPGTTPGDLEMIYGDSAMGVVASCLRGTIVAAPGNRLVVMDLSQIEAVVLAWLADQTESLDCFRRRDDIYTDTARRVGSTSRQLGKVLVLACIAEGEPVLTDQGLVPIERVTKDMRLWDGIEWVTHDGVVYQGEREVIHYDGLRATPDHLVWTEGRSDPVPFGQAASTLSRLVRSGAGGAPLRYVGSGRSDFRSSDERAPDSVSLYGVWVGQAGGLAQPAAWPDEGLSLSVPVEHEPLCRTLDASNYASHGRSQGSLPKPEKSSVEALRRTGDHFRLSGFTRGSGLDRREPGSPVELHVDRSDQQRQRIHTGKSALGYKTRADVEQPTSLGKTRVYDILNAGPRHRFTVSGRTVSNCGFGMGPTRFQGTAQGYGLTLDMATCEKMVYAWRAANDRIQRFWWDAHHRMLRLIDCPPGTVIDMPKVRFKRAPGSVLIQLPSERHLVYRGAHVADNEAGYPEFCYMGSGGGGWTLQRAWPGKTTENIVQAIARDVLADHMVELHRLGVPLVATVHDELIAEVPEVKADQTYAMMQRVMRQPPRWAPDMPMNAAGFIASRYRKN